MLCLDAAFKAHLGLTISRRSPARDRCVKSGHRAIETAGRSISDYLVDEVDDSSSRPFVADALSGAARTSRLALDCPHSTARTLLARSALDCRRWPPGPCQSRGTGSAAGPATRDVGSCGVR
jgi:hypothetical protein